MTRLTVRPVSPGATDAMAVVSGMSLNFPAAFLKALNILPFKRGEIRDPHHDLFRMNVAGKALVFPTCIGSTYTGLVVLELIKSGHAPAAIIVSLADPLLVSGCVLARVWCNRNLPVLELRERDDIRKIATGDRIAYAEGRSWLDVTPAAGRQA